jgi:hypothetical protein
MIAETIIILNKMNKNRHMYTKDSFDSFIDQTIPVKLGFDNVDGSSAPIIGKADNLRIEDDHMVADIYLDTENVLLKKLMSGPKLKPRVFVTAGFGRIDNNNIVKDFIIDYIANIPKKDSAFEAATAEGNDRG